MAKLEIITFQQQIGLNFKEEIESTRFGSLLCVGQKLGGTLLKVDHTYVESFKMWCWRKMEKISRTHRAGN